MCTQNGGTFFMNDDDEFFYIVNFLSLNKKSNIRLFFYKRKRIIADDQTFPYFECWPISGLKVYCCSWFVYSNICELNAHL